MDKIVQYREIIIKLMEEYARPQPANGDIYLSPLVDTTHDHYGVIMAGWSKDHHIQGLAVHIDIIDGKIWIQHDGTAPGVALDLVEAGIPREDIVLGFHPPHIRQHTDFAVG